MTMWNSNNTARFSLLALLILGLGCYCDAFTLSVPTRLSSAPSIQTALQESSNTGVDDGLVDDYYEESDGVYASFKETPSDPTRLSSVPSIQTALVQESSSTGVDGLVVDDYSEESDEVYASFTETPSTPTLLSSAPSIQTALQGSSGAELDAIVDDAKMRFRIFQDGLNMRIRIFEESQKAGSPFKQSIANVFAGEYDQEAVKASAMELIQSAPLVMFTWESSPSCKQAKVAFETACANVTIVRLDDPWAQGNPLRAEIGKIVGRSSLPMIFLNGEYIGGYDGGTSEDAPGILKMAFQGTLLPKLQAGGVIMAPGTARKAVLRKQLLAATTKR
jgi:glutaredoxin 3